MDSAAKRQSRSFDDLPEEITEDILQRLPITTLGRCMCVKKQWRFIIRNPNFIATNTMTKRRSNQFLILRDRYFSSNGKECHMYSDDNSDSFEFHRSLTLPCEIYSDDASIPTCNGLICGVLKGKGNILVWNPIIKKILTLPKSPYIPRSLFSGIFGPYLAFAFDSLTDDFKLVTIYSGIIGYDTRHPVVSVFSFKSYLWNVVSQQIPAYRFYGHSLPILNGALHWVGQESNCPRAVIVAFNVNTEVFKEIELPKSLNHTIPNLILGAYMQSSIVCCCDIDRVSVQVWMMKEYGQVESWSKMLTFDTEKLCLPAGICTYHEKILGLRYTVDLLWNGFTRNKYLRSLTISTDLVCGENKCVAFRWDLRYFEESLMLLDNDNAVSYSTDKEILEWK